MHSSGTLGSADRQIFADGSEAAPSMSPGKRQPWCRPGRRQPRTAAGLPKRATDCQAGLYLLCAAEACAGFAFYTLGALLVLFLTERGGLGQGTALRWVGTFQGVGYVAPLVGGILADRWLGLRVAVRSGAVLLAMGFAGLALFQGGYGPAGALALLIGGAALFRSNITAMVGRLYRRGDLRRDGALRLLYSAFNLGAVFAPPIAGSLVRAQLWRLPFAVAGVVMLLAILILRIGNPWLAKVDQFQRSDDEKSASHELAEPSVGLRHWFGMAVVAQCALLWSIAYGQSDGSLLLWARDHTRRTWAGFELPASAFASVPALLVLILTPLLAAADRGVVATMRMRKLLAGLFCTSAGFALLAWVARSHERHSSAAWLLACFALVTLGELIVAPITQSLMLTLAPPKKSATALGIWYAASAAGLWGSGQLGTFWERWPKSNFFLLVAIMPILAALLVSGLSSHLRLQFPSVGQERLNGGTRQD